jgi:hypothetical protein
MSVKLYECIYYITVIYMTSLISYALDQVGYELPAEVLKETFASRRYDPARGERFRDNNLGLSIEAVIRKEIIEGRVAVDINLCSGVETVISLSGLAMEQIDPWNIIYRIPDKLTGGRNITAVYGVTFGQGYNGNNGMNSGINSSGNSSQLANAAAAVYQATAPIPNTQSPFVSIIGDNTILINDIQGINNNMWLRCMVTHEPNFANIKPPFYRKFADMVVLAVKAAVYNKLVILLDEGQIKAGASIGRFREVVDGYADANQMYKDFLHDKWRVTAVVNDTAKYRNILKLAVGGQR